MKKKLKGGRLSELIAPKENKKNEFIKKEFFNLVYKLLH